MSDHTPGTGTSSDDEQAVSTPPGVPAQEDRSQPGLAGDEGRRDEPAADSAEDAHGGTLDVEDEQPDPDTTTEETAEQRENTEASTEQPSQ
ncbi:hypothetical protein [Nocardioides aurantiacus]|uniref:hypothetical protein n=1 Tax=Nocardioides aurantiacus TaxID=86796 RepID=UPI00403F7B35